MIPQKNRSFSAARQKTKQKDKKLLCHLNGDPLLHLKAHRGRFITIAEVAKNFGPFLSII
jgi:hypothetical protein